MHLINGRFTRWSALIKMTSLVSPGGTYHYSEYKVLNLNYSLINTILLIKFIAVNYMNSNVGH